MGLTAMNPTHFNQAGYMNWWSHAVFSETVAIFSTRPGAVEMLEMPHGLQAESVEIQKNIMLNILCSKKSLIPR